MTDAAPILPPLLGAADAVALSRALLRAFDAAHGVDSSVKRAARLLRDAAEALRVAWEASVRASIAADGGSTARRADLDEDAAWLALHTWLAGWATLPSSLAPEGETARAVLAAVFPDGTRFTELSYALEWAEADRKLALLDAEGHVARVEALGGAAMLRALRSAHAAYERALGVSHTEGAPHGAMGAALAPVLGDARLALEAYLAALHAAGAALLLAPLHQWLAERALRSRPRA